MKIYTLQALAQNMKTSHGYLRHLMLKIKKGEIASWRGYRFLAVGEGKRSTWIAYPEELDLELVTG